MFRYLLAAALAAPLAFPQTFPSFQWVKELDASGGDTFAGLGVDAAGNTYVAGSTYSASFPVKSAIQSQIHSSGIYRLDGPGTAYAALGLSSAYIVAVDPLSPNTIYAFAGGNNGQRLGLVKSVDAGATFTQLSFPSTEITALVIDPVNTQILYAGTFDQGLFKSTDAGATWTPSNGSLTAPQSDQFSFQYVWIDPNNPTVLLANVFGSLYRSADAAASWQIALPSAGGQDIDSVSFNSAVPGLLYAVSVQGAVLVSADDGLTFTSITTPIGFGVVLPDPNHAGRLLASTSGGIYQSTDGGKTWAIGVNLDYINYLHFVADWANGYLYTGNSSVVRISADLQTVTPLGPPSVGYFSELTAVGGHVYVATAGSRDVYVSKLDAAGNIVYSTYFGGSSDDSAIAMTVDKAGNVYVTGSTSSLDFPVTKGAYLTTSSNPIGFSNATNSFLFKLNPDGSLGYSTYFLNANPAAVGVDAAGSAYIAGSSYGNLPVTQGAYQTACGCGSFSTGFFNPAPQKVQKDLTVFSDTGFVTKFDPAGATLVYSTYVGNSIELENALNAFALAPDGSAYVATATGLFHLNATGSALLGSIKSTGSSSPGVLSAQSLTVAPDGSLYAAGQATQFQTTPGAYQTSMALPQGLPGQSSTPSTTVVVHYDSTLSQVLAATLFGYSRSTTQITLDSSGNVYLAGGTGPQGLPTRTPIQAGFAGSSGFVSQLSGDLSTLLFSSYFGNTSLFSVQGFGLRPDGNVMLAGATGFQQYTNSGPENVWINSVTLAPPPALRVDSVVNAASLLDGPIAPGETIVVRGAGFGTGSQLSIGGAIVPSLSSTSTSITATVPASLPLGAAEVSVASGGAASNQVLVPVALTAPGLFSQDGSGFGQGYILNQDGTLNSPSHPAKPGDIINVFATGVGPINFTNGYAVPQSAANVFIDGFIANGIEAFVVPVPGLPGNVFEIQVIVPNPASLVSANPNLQGFVFPPLVGVTMVVNGVVSQSGISFSISN